MEYIRECAVLLCTASLASGVIVFIIPDGRLKKTADIAVSLLFIGICANFFAADINFDTDIKASYEENVKIEENYGEYLKKSAAEVTEKILKNELDKICSGEYTIESDWSVTESKAELVDIRITINAEDSSKISTIKTKTGSITGVFPEVRIDGH